MRAHALITGVVASLSLVLTACGGATKAEPEPDAGLSDVGAPGVDADGGAPLPTHHEQWVAYCATLTSCGLSLEPSGAGLMTGCLSAEDPSLPSDLQPADVVRDCVAAARSDCARAAACLNAGQAPALCASDAASTVSCAGSVAHFCIAGASERQSNCGVWGEICVNDPTLQGCTPGRCDTDGARSCLGSTLLRCETYGSSAGYLSVEAECGTFRAATCTALGDAGTCVGGGAKCANDRCEGSSWVACLGGQEASFDCATWGLKCIASATAHCGLAADCDEQAFRDSCAGSVLTFCNAGKIDQRDCVSAGFSSCHTDPQSFDTGRCFR